MRLTPKNSQRTPVKVPRHRHKSFRGINKMTHGLVTKDGTNRNGIMTRTITQHTQHTLFGDYQTYEEKEYDPTGWEGQEEYGGYDDYGYDDEGTDDWTEQFDDEPVKAQANATICKSSNTPQNGFSFTSGDGQLPVSLFPGHAEMA